MSAPSRLLHRPLPAMLLLALLAFLWPAPALAGTNALWRTTIYQGESTFAWRWPSTGAWGATDDDGRAVAANTWCPLPQPDHDDTQMVAGFSFPKPGLYTIYSVAFPLGKVEVKPIPPAYAARKWAAITPAPDEGDDSPNMQAKLDAGFNLYLSGEYHLHHALKLPPGSKVRGITPECAVIIRVPDKDYAQRIFVPSADIQLESLTIRAPGYVLHRFPDPAPNITLRRVHFVGGSLGEWNGPGLAVIDCDFDRTLAIKVGSHSLFLRNKFHGVGDGTAWTSTGADAIAMIDATFDGTDRGPTCQVGGANGNRSVTNCLFSRLLLSNIAWVSGGSEWFLVEGEGGHFDNNIITHLRARGCPDALKLWMCGAKDNIFRDIEADQSAGIFLRADKANELQAGNVFERLEMHGGRFEAGPFAVNNTVRDSAWFDPSWGRGGSFDFKPERYRTVAVFTGSGDKNLARSVRIVGLGNNSIAWGWRLEDVVAQ